MQKRVDLNERIYSYLCSGVTMRKTARELKCSYKTVYRKFLWLAQRAKTMHFEQKFLIETLYFDEMESIEHTKLKPLTIALAVDEQYRILGVQVGKIPAKGRLAHISRSKYGPRENESAEKTLLLLSQMKSQLKQPPIVIKSDAKTEYKTIVAKVFPQTTYEQHASRGNKEKKREQKYLKKEKHIHDPLFPLNQRCALLRDHVKRLVRRSWCTTKIPDHLELALYLFIANNNKYQLI
jgi:hypothetical protein